MPSYVKRHLRKSQSERRQEILDATLQLISEHGLEGATVSRIAQAVGLTPGALYRHFDSRAALISEANRVANERTLTWVESSKAPDALQRLEEIGEAQAEWARENYSTIVRPFFLEVASAPDPELEDRLTFTSIKMFSAFMDIAEEGRRQGAIRPDVQAKDVAWAMLMFAWTQDIALMSGADQYIADGTLARNLKRLLDSFRPEAAPTAE
jgi:AcrR family transcriptional regulator